MNILTIISITIALLYFLVSLFLSRGLYKLKKKSVSTVKSNNTKLTVSVLVAARNEEITLPRLFESLQNQTYPSSQFTITVINDRSTDETAAVVEQYQKEFSNLSLLTVTETPHGIAPKKNAITLGVAQTEGEIILITDADCTVPPQWIEQAVAQFQDSAVGLVQGLTGYRKIETNSLLYKFQSIDFFSHSVVAAAGIGANVPINSNANNFAYRRTIFDSLDGYGEVSHVISGDDDLLLQRVWEEGSWNIRYMATPEAAVETDCAATFGEMIQQRRRWGSKTVYYKPLQVVLLSIIFLSYLSLLGNIILLPFTITNLPLVMVLYLIKIIGELLFLIPGSSLFNRTELRRDIWWASILQLIMVIYSVLGGVFGTFSWKGDSFSRSTKK